MQGQGKYVKRKCCPYISWHVKGEKWEIVLYNAAGVFGGLFSTGQYFRACLSLLNFFMQLNAAWT